MQAIMELFTTKTESINNVNTQLNKKGKPKLNQKFERVLFYSMSSFLVMYLYAQYV